MPDLIAQLQNMQKQIDLLAAEVRVLKSFDYLPKNAAGI